MDRTFQSPKFWLGKVLTTIVPIVYILWRRVEMETSELIALTPAEFGPELLVMGFAIGALITFILSLCPYSEKAKEVARVSGGKLAYGMIYLSKNIIVLVLAGLASLIAPGYYYDLVAAVPTEGGCILIGVVAAAVVGLGGETLASKAVEFLRNRQKTADALTTPKE